MPALRKAIFGFLLVGLLASVGGYGWWAIGPLDLAELDSRYKLPQSQFAEIDGLRVHYTVDGGDGLPCLVLLHGEYMSLRVWDGLVAALRPRFRIVRMDLIASGLTGPSSGNADAIAANLHVVDAVTRRVNADTFVLAGASTGGVLAAAFAVAHPERVARLILIDADGAPVVADRHPPNRGWLGDWASAHLQMRTTWAGRLYAQFGVFPPEREFVQMVFDMNRRPGAQTEQQRLVAAVRAVAAQDLMAKVTAPSLLLWGDADPTTPPADAEALTLWLTSAPSLIKTYPHMGHYPYVEIPDVVAKDIAAFVDGAMDPSLRRTERVPISEGPSEGDRRG